MNKNLPNLKDLLKKRIPPKSKLAVLCVGSELRGDDAAGMLIAHKLSKHYKDNDRIKIFFGETAPENLTGEIKKFAPSHLIIIDAADISAEPGTIQLIDPETVGGISFSTHMIPLKIMVDYMTGDCSCQTTIIGIQPRSIKFGDTVSKEVLKAVDEVAKAIKEVAK